MSDTIQNQGEATPELPPAAQAAKDQGLPLWTTEQMRELFAVEGFAAPFVIVRRKEDGKVGTLQFTHAPRYYFAWVEDN